MNSRRKRNVKFPIVKEELCSFLQNDGYIKLLWYLDSIAYILQCYITALFLFQLFIYFNFIYFWLCWVLVAACGIFCCGAQALCFGAWASLQLWRAGFLSSSCGAQAPGHMGSVVLWHAVEGSELRICGSLAQLPCGMCDLSSLTRDRTCVPCIVRWILYHWTTRAVPSFIFK